MSCKGNLIFGKNRNHICEMLNYGLPLCFFSFNFNKVRLSLFDVVNKKIVHLTCLFSAFQKKFQFMRKGPDFKTGTNLVTCKFLFFFLTLFKFWKNQFFSESMSLWRFFHIWLELGTLLSAFQKFYKIT